MIYADDLAYVHHAGFGDYARRAAPEVVRLLARRPAFSPRRRGGSLVVEFGCGGGTTAAYLADHGFRVLGVDQSPAMVKLARRTAPGARFHVGTLASTRIPRCAAVIALGEVVNYVNGRRVGSRTHDRQVSRFFARAARALEPGGLLLFDFMESARGRTYEAMSRTGGDWALVASARADGPLLTRHITTIRRVQRTLRVAHEVHRVRLYGRRTIAAALRRAGFAVTMRRSIGRVRVIRGDAVAYGSLMPEGRSLKYDM
jgi:SAM-dependent methyltransferase